MKLTCVFLCCVMSAAADVPQPYDQEFAALNERRGRRLELIRFLKASDKVYESSDGLLSAHGQADPALRSALDAENADRKRQFELIARHEGKSPDEAGKAFAEKIGAPVVPRQIQAVAAMARPVGTATLTASAKRQIDTAKQLLLADLRMPLAYKQLIDTADRYDSAEDVRFAKDTPMPDTNSMLYLQRLAERLADAGNQNWEVICIGFADGPPSGKSTEAAAMEHAKFTAELLKKLGVKNTTPAGFLNALPHPPSNKDAGRTHHRRVEIWIRRSA